MAPAPARADDVGEEEPPPPPPRVRVLEEPPQYGLYYDRWEPTFYTGFAPRSLDAARLHLHVGKGNQLRITQVLADEVIASYGRDLLARAETVRALIASGRLVLTQNDGFEVFESALAAADVRGLVARESGQTPTDVRAQNLALMKRLNPGRVFEIDIDEQALVARWIGQLRVEDGAGMGRERQLELLNELLPTRLWLAETDAATTRDLEALVALARASGPADESAGELRTRYFALLDAVSGGIYPRANGRVRFTEFTAIHPIGTFNEYTDYKGNQIPLYPTPGRRALTTHQRTHTVDHVPTKANYSYSPWIPYMHVGDTLHNSFHTLWWRMEPEQAGFLPAAWTRDDPRRQSSGPSRYLWLLSRGPMSSGCTHVNTGHINELRQLMPSDTDKLYEIDTFLNRSYDYDVFDIDGDLQPEVMGVRYFIAYSLRNKKPHRLRVRNERAAYYRWLYGDDLTLAADGSGTFRDVQDGHFVGRRALRGRRYAELPLYEADYEPEKIQFYRLVDIEFARELRKVSVHHPMNGATPASLQ